MKQSDTLNNLVRDLTKVHRTKSEVRKLLLEYREMLIEHYRFYGVSYWAQEGTRLGYWDFFKDLIIKEYEYETKEADKHSKKKLLDGFAHPKKCKRCI